MRHLFDFHDAMNLSLDFNPVRLIDRFSENPDAGDHLVLMVKGAKHPQAGYVAYPLPFQIHSMPGLGTSSSGALQHQTHSERVEFLTELLRTMHALCTFPPANPATVCGAVPLAPEGSATGAFFIFAAAGRGPTACLDRTRVRANLSDALRSMEHNPKWESWFRVRSKEGFTVPTLTLKALQGLPPVHAPVMRRPGHRFHTARACSV